MILGSAPLENVHTYAQVQKGKLTSGTAEPGGRRGLKGPQFQAKIKKVNSESNISGLKDFKFSGGGFPQDGAPPVLACKPLQLKICSTVPGHVSCIFINRCGQGRDSAEIKQ